ncbi:MAG: DUF3426 domain-containing protein [Burkholderiaceae bacterium]|nr:DUF3426 domain-containing protein [Burkholderiaceae bacterium]
MALATQCPHCHTTFRVAHDQLKLRAGLVRCGSCKEIFNGIEHLLPSETAAATRTPAPVETAAPAPAAAEPVPQPAPAASKPAASDQLDFAYPDMDDEDSGTGTSGSTDLTKPASIPDTVLARDLVDEAPAPHTNEPEEVKFVETPRKTPLAAPAVVEPEPLEHSPAHSPHDEPPTAVDEQAPSDPLTRMTLIDVEEQGTLPPDPEAPDPLDKVMEDFERKPARGKRGGKGKPYARSPLVSMQEEMPRAEPTMEEAAPGTAPAAEPEPAAETYSDAEEPDFVKRERYRRTRGRAIGIVMNTASVLMLVLAVGQGAYIFRDQLATRFPETRPALQEYCAILDCKIGLPMQIEAVSFEGEQFQMLSTRKDTGEFSLTLRNTGHIAQTWPHLELALNDNNNVPLARRVFAPEEYLPAGLDPQKGFAANSEQPVKLYFEFADAKPAGFHVGVFYP